MEKKKPKGKTSRKKPRFNFGSEKEIAERLKQARLERKKREAEGYSLTISYPIQYQNWGDGAIKVQGADGFDHYFYPTKSGGWDYDGGGMEFQGGKPKRGKGIVGSVKIFLPVKSIKIGRGGNGLTIVDAKGETYKFS
jgi:hypothetical protein